MMEYGKTTFSIKSRLLMACKFRIHDEKLNGKSFRLWQSVDPIGSQLVGREVGWLDWKLVGLSGKCYVSW